MADYQNTSGNFIIRTSDKASIPADPANRDYAAFLDWKNKGGVPDPYVAPAPDYKSLALDALDASDTTALRCFKATLPFPPEWKDYTTKLRDIAKTGVGPLPTRPAYPAGT